MNKSNPPAIPMIVSSSPGIHFTKIKDRVIQHKAMMKKRMATFFSLELILPKRAALKANSCLSSAIRLLCSGKANLVIYHHAKNNKKTDNGNAYMNHSEKVTSR